MLTVQPVHCIVCPVLFQRQPSFTTEFVRAHGRALHKRSTIEFLVRGKMAGGALEASGGAPGAAPTVPPQAYPHRFDRCSYSTPTYCDLCSSILWGLVKTGMERLKLATLLP